MKRLVMLRAWEIKRANKEMSFSECLKLAWHECKGNASYKMYVPTRKQIGVIYAAFKNGCLNISEKAINSMYNLYDRHFGSQRFGGTSYFENEVATLGRAVEACFAKDYRYVESILCTL